MALRRRKRTKLGSRGKFVVAGLAAIATGAVAVGLLDGSAGSVTDHHPAVSPDALLAAPAAVLSAGPLGLNVGPWDYQYAAPVSANGGLDVMQPMLKKIGLSQFRYGGGGYADVYNWQTNTEITKCEPDTTTAEFTAACAKSAVLNYSQFSQQARAIGAQSFVTVDYGSGTPAEAAAWVATAKATPGEQAALWEIGNEGYGCYEANNELALAPEYYKGFKMTQRGQSTNPTCPTTTEGSLAGLKTMATSYAVNAGKFMGAMKAADPHAQLGVPWLFGYDVAGAASPHASVWNGTVLGADSKYVSFVDAHWYPFYFHGKTGGQNPTDAQVLQSLRQIPAVASRLSGELHKYVPGARIVIGETAPSSSATTTGCTPVGALFAAGDVLQWLANGAESVDWWDLNNYGNDGPRCISPDYGLFTSASPPATETPYYGYLLASKLVRPGARLGRQGNSDQANVLSFYSLLPGGTRSVAFINLSTSSAKTVRYKLPFSLTGTMQTWTYSAGNQNATNSRVSTGHRSAASVASSISLPAESIVVFSGR